MTKNTESYTEGYIKLAWTILSSSQDSSPAILTKLYHHFQTKYGTFLADLITNSQLSSTNLIISLYYLYKHYHQNTILYTKLEKAQQYPQTSTDDTGIDSMHIYTIITSLILSNKSFDDQSYTLKTWWIIINNTCKNCKFGSTVDVDLKLLNTMESFFLSSLDFKLSFTGMSSDGTFWSLFNQGVVANIDDVTISMFKSLAGTSVEEEEAVAASLLITPIKTQSFQSQVMTQPPPPLISINSITPPPQLTTSSCSPLVNNATTFSSPLNYPLTPSTPLDYCCKRRKVAPVLPSQPPQQQQQQQQQQYLQSSFAQPQYIAPPPPQWTSSFDNITPLSMAPLPQPYHVQYTQTAPNLPPAPFQYDYNTTYQQGYPSTKYQLPNVGYALPQQPLPPYKPVYNSSLMNPYTNQQYCSYW
ncbi:hypothetical protein CANMA_004415 [Candida margitis]|uniref:uncharacterized protein n=1 Tax=Candida margitis TaxID=1775924 RepID=UPI002227D9DA|nr:uncharacterized protein CANMA_004415 [Candida margitis]KAI5957411.1 hypothetical protein CANMA_004415 [Candida margitis]